MRSRAACRRRSHEATRSRFWRGRMIGTAFFLVRDLLHLVAVPTRNAVRIVAIEVMGGLE